MANKEQNPDALQIDSAGPVKTTPSSDPLLTEDLSDFELEEVAGGIEIAAPTISGGVTWTRA